VSEALLFGVWLLGQTLAFAPGYGKAKLSAGRLFQILDRPCALPDAQETKMASLSKGFIEFSKVDFFYPNRPEVRVLRELSLQIKPGSSVALAGASGCGKSTVIQLLQRFYDPDSGHISMDGHDIKNIPMSELRGYMSIVSQVRRFCYFLNLLIINICPSVGVRCTLLSPIKIFSSILETFFFIICLMKYYEVNLETLHRSIIGTGAV